MNLEMNISVKVDAPSISMLPATVWNGGDDDFSLSFGTVSGTMTLAELDSLIYMAQMAQRDFAIQNCDHDWVVKGTDPLVGDPLTVCGECGVEQEAS